MQGIEFETDTISSSTQKNLATPKSSILVQWLLKFGVKDTSTANYVLLGTVGILLGITIFLYAGLLNKPKIDHKAATQANLIMEMSQR